MNDMLLSPLFGITLSAFCFEAGVFISGKIRTPLANPLLIGITLCIIILKIFNIPIDSYNIGGDIITMFLVPVAATLAVTIYSKFDILKANFLPVFAGTFIGSLSSVASTYILCKLFGIDELITSSLIPKSITSSVAVEISAQLGGNTSITVAAVIYSGILGTIFSPVLIRLLKIDNSVARGVAIGTSSHAMGTSTAVKIGETEGAMSSISIGMAGIITVIIAMFLY